MMKGIDSKAFCFRRVDLGLHKWKFLSDGELDDSYFYCEKCLAEARVYVSKGERKMDFDEVTE